MRGVLHRIASDTRQLARVLTCWYLDHDWSGWKDKPRGKYHSAGYSIRYKSLPVNYQDRTCWRCGKYEERRKPRPPVLGLQSQTND